MSVRRGRQRPADARRTFAAGTIFLGGLLTALTPCVDPLIPVTVGVFGARQADSRGRAFILTTAYVFGMGAVFSILGVIAALSGKAFGSAPYRRKTCPDRPERLRLPGRGWWACRGVSRHRADGPRVAQPFQRVIDDDEFVLMDDARKRGPEP